MDLRALLEGVLLRWKLILAVPIVLLVLTGAVLRVVPPRFESSVQLLMFDPQQAGVNPLGQQPATGRDFDTQAMTTEMTVIKSSSVALRVAKDLDLANDPEFQRRGPLASLGISENGWLATHLRQLLVALGLGGTNGQSSVALGPGETDAAKVATAARALLDHIRVVQVPFSYVLGVSATSRSPQMAQRIAATVIDDYLAGLREGRQRALQQIAVWLQAKLAELKGRVVETETAIEKLKAASGLSDTGKGNIIEQQIADLNAQLMVARADVGEKRARLEQARQLSTTSGSLQDMPEGAVSSSMIGPLRQEQLHLSQQEVQLRSELGDHNRWVLAIAAQLAAVNAAINRESAHILANLHDSYDIARRREQALEADLERLTAAQNGSGDYVKLQQLQRIADADAKLYGTYLTQYNEIDTQKSLQEFGPRIISPAAVPTAPSFPPTKLLYVAAGVMGLGIGVVLAFLLDYFAGGVRTSAQAQNTFGHPVVGALPMVREGRSRGADKTRDLVRGIVNAPMSPLSEAVRAVRIALHLSNPNRAPMVVLVTSSLPEEGKSSIALFLGASSAGAGESTVVVDCDLRSRTISRDFDEQQLGLTDVLTGIADIATVVVRHPIAGCDIVTAGSYSRAPADLLTSRRFADVTARLRERYAYIILDTPPLLSAVDALTVATYADKILMTIDNGSTRLDSILESFRRLRPEEHRVAGMVFNKVTPDQLRRYGIGAYY
jgi:polysaccharide biosynthesis transport protein